MYPGGASHLGFVTGLRGLAAFYVLASHVWYHVWPAVPPPYGYGRAPDGWVAWLTGWLYYGHFGVVVFLVLSGFCLMLPVVDNGGVLHGGPAAFLARRARRILPPYYGALALSLLLIALWIGERTGSQWDISLPVSNAGLLSHLLLLHDLVEPTQINYALWSVALEVQLYLLFPWLVSLWRRLGAPLGAGLCVGGVYGIVLALPAAGVDAVPSQFIGLCACFVIGMGCAVLFRNKGAWVCAAPWCMIAAALLALVVALCAWWGHAVAEQRFALLDFLCAAASAALLLDAGRRPQRNAVRALLETPLLLRLGAISYSLYLVHAPLLQLVWQVALLPLDLQDAVQFGALLLIGVPVSVAVACIFHAVCERPFLAHAATGRKKKMEPAPSPDHSPLAGCALMGSQRGGRPESSRVLPGPMPPSWRRAGPQVFRIKRKREK